MADKNEGVIIILSSPSGAGKTTLVKKISKLKNYQISISYTTRKPRANERNGRDYFFVNNKRFKKLIKENKFLEYAKVFKNYYGSLKETVIKKLKKGKNVLFDIDWQGTGQINNQKLRFKIITIFILPPSRKELFNRLLKRDHKDKKIAKERMRQFKKDIMHWKDYEFTVINDKVETCYKEILYLIKNYKNKRMKLKNNKKYIKKHIKSLIS